MTVMAIGDDAVAARQARREAVTIEHMQSENVQEWDRTIKTFSHARYELPDGRVIDGRDDVMRYWVEGRTIIPDQRNELIELTHHADGSVIIEFWLRGTHLGSFRGLPPTGRAFECKTVAVFVFEDDRLICERAYFDSATILRQLGIAHDPLTLRGRLATLANHPLTIGGALLRQLRR
jgi:steroid delta-isomerase-like uncharacterized protein